MRATQRIQQLQQSDSAALGPHLTTQPTLDTRPPVKRLLRIGGVLERYPVSRSQLYNMIASGNFPKPVHVGGGQAAFWVESEIDEWIQLQIDAERRAA
jgi:prophage regulatory protein